MRKIKITFGAINFTEDRKLQFPPKNAHSKSANGPMMEIPLKDNEKEIDR